MPLVTSRPALPRAPGGELRVTWIGHATFLLQIGGTNVLTDPVWSRRVSPLSWVGPARITEPGMPFDALPPIDVVLISHDHYDHLDRPTVCRLHERFGDALCWIAPLGYASWLASAGPRRVIELDWWQSANLSTRGGTIEVVAAPTQHWSQRTPFLAQSRLWASFAVSSSDGVRLFFCGDSGYFKGFSEIGRRFGPFDAALLPIGAYEPRWFMRPAHMNPEEAVHAFADLGGTGTFIGMHWGTFHLTDEPVLEPPVRVRQAWKDALLPEARLWVPAHGETRVIAHGRHIG